MKNGLNEKLTRVDTAVSTIKQNLRFEENALIEDVAASTSLKRLLNLFIQDNEPEIKEGIWIETAENLPVDNIVIDELIYTNEEWEDPTLIGKAEDFTAGASTSNALVGDYLYYTGRNNQPTATSMYRLNIHTYQIEDLGKPTVALGGGHPLVVGTDIYYVGNTSLYQVGSRGLVKYDTLTNTYTKLADIPRDTSYVSQYVHYNGFIYVFFAKDNSTTSQSNGYQYRHNLKYNIATNEWIELPEDPYWYKSSSRPMVLGNKVWFLFHTLRTSYHNNIANYWEIYRKSLVFDLDTEEFIIPNVAFQSIGSSADAINGSTSYTSPQPVAVGDMCYLFTRFCIYKIPISEFVISNTEKTLYFKDYETIEYNELLDKNKSNCTRFKTSLSDDKLFITGLSDCSGGDIVVLPLKSKSYSDNTLIIRQGISNSSAVQTELFDISLDGGRLTYPVYNVYHYTTDKGMNSKLTLYYGNGTEWIRFKN